MRRELLIVLLFLAASAGAGVTANLAVYKLPWIRTPQVDPTNPPLPPPPEKTAAEALVEHLRSATARFVDAREEKEYAEGHLFGAINLPETAVYANADRVTATMSPDEKVIVYCGGKTCEAAETVADALRRDYGYRNVEVYKPGWDEIGTLPIFKEFITAGE